MKRIIVALALVLGSYSSKSQATITASNFNPVAGDQLTAYYLPDSLQSTGGNGLDQVWSYQGLNNGQRISTTYLSPASTPRYAVFSEANLCAYDSSNDLYSYYYADSTGLRMLGGVSSNYSTGNAISNACYLYKLPLSYGTAYSMQVNEHQENLGFTSIITNRIGAQTWTVAGRGTLILPTGTYKNVLKVEYVCVDSTATSGGVFTSSVTTSTQWMYPGIHQPILSTNVKRQFPVGGTPSVYKTIRYTGQTPLAINASVKNNYKFTSYPNPATSTTNLKFSLDFAADVTVHIMSLNGQVVSSQRKGKYERANDVVIPIGLDDLAAGAYIIDLDLSGVHIYQQILKH